nr:molybdopterin-dependent oxidoreductase [Melioribacteraceae bacterium]
MGINRSEIRVDAVEKLNGEAKYIRDEKIDNLLFGTTIRSTISHGIIKSITFDKSINWNEFTIVDYNDIPFNHVAFLEFDMPFLVEKKTKYLGEPILLIAHKDKEILKSLANFIYIEYEELPSAFDLRQSENSNTNIYNNNNIIKEINIKKGSISKAKENSDKIIKFNTETGFQEHLYLEPQGIVAIPDENKIIIKGSMQCPYYIKNALEKMFDNKYHITIIQSTTGGAFGGKEDFP